MAKEYKDLAVGLDIGTSKVMAVVAEIVGNGELRVVGLGVAHGNVLKRGVVVTIDAKSMRCLPSLFRLDEL